MVYADSTSPIRSKLIVGEVNDACITMDTKEEYIILAMDEGGTLFFGDINKICEICTKNF